MNRIRIKGAWIPSIFIWMLGFLHGKILKTAALDPEGRIASSYVTGKLKLFRELSAQRVEQLEQNLKAVRIEASGLMAEEADLHQQQLPMVEEGKGHSVQVKRSNRRRNRQMADTLSRLRKM